MAVCSTTALRKYLTQHSNLGQPLREKASSTTGGHAKGETIRNSGRYRRPLFKSSHTEPSPAFSPAVLLVADLPFSQCDQGQELLDGERLRRLWRKERRTQGSQRGVGRQLDAYRT